MFFVLLPLLNKANVLKQAAKSLLSGKASVSAVGDLHVLPFATDIGLTV